MKTNILKGLLKFSVVNKFLFCILLASTCVSYAEQIKTPTVLNLNVHGGGVIKYKNKYYWYGEKRDSQGLTSKVNLYSSEDLVKWSYVGVILDISKMQPIHTLERPKIIYNSKTKKFVMWFHLELNGQYKTAKVGVAESNDITRPFTFISEFWPNAGDKAISAQYYDQANSANISIADEQYRKSFQRGQDSRDLTIFKDGDGTAYLIYISELNKAIHITKLNPEYNNTTPSYIRIRIGDRNEAPAVFKYDNKYYLITSGLKGFSPTVMNIYESSNMLGDWLKLQGPVNSKLINEVQTSFKTQPSFILHNEGKFIYIGDRWIESNLKRSEQVLLDIDVSTTPSISWK